MTPYRSTYHYQLILDNMKLIGSDDKVRSMIGDLEAP